jgi:amidohydrolase
MKLSKLSRSIGIVLGMTALFATAPNLQAKPEPSVVTDKVSAMEEQVIQWRHHFHANPELSNREFETAAYIAKYLTSLGLQVQTGIAKTGVVGLLDTGKPGPVVALRADIDGLPVLEDNDLP